MTPHDLVKTGRTRAERPAFKDRLAQLIALRTDANAPDADRWTDACLTSIGNWLGALDFDVTHHVEAAHPFLIARRIEDAAFPTVLTYSHGDVVPGMDGDWQDDLDPWSLTEVGERWYGRGIADNKGQFLVNLTAIEALLEARGHLGFNLIWLIEMGEEIGSPGLAALCERESGALSADLLLASDGPRVAADTPTLFLGARGGITFRLDLKRRDGGRHSGNFGGALRNPALELAHALSTITDRNGALQIAGWTPGTIPQATQDALRDINPAGGAVDADWGAQDLSPAERIHAWSSAEVLAIHAGHPPHPVNAIPPEASAWVQLRFAPGTPDDDLCDTLRAHLDANGFADITITPDGPAFRASATPVDHPAVARINAAAHSALGHPPAILPSLGGSLPNDIFRDTLGLPTIWVPHSYPGCSQHAPNEHLPKALLFEATGFMCALLGSIAGSRPDDWR